MCKRKIWLSPCPGVGMKAVILKKRFGFYKILYKDLDRKCRIEWCPSYYAGESIIERE